MQKSELELIIETIPDAVTVVDRYGNITYANRAAEIILGLSRSEIERRTYNTPSWKITTSEGKPFPEEELPFAQVSKLKKPVYGIEHAIERTDGKRAILSINAAPILDENGNVESMVAALTDITERRTAEDALRTNEERYCMAQAIGHVGNWEYNLQTTQFWGSDEAKRIYGFDPKQPGFTTEEVESRIPERERVHQALVDLVGEGKPYNLEFEIIPKNSTEPRIIASVAELQRDEHGNPLKVVGVIQDITERKRAEGRVMLLNFALDHVREAAYLTDESGRFIYVNEEVLRSIGYSRDELFGGMTVLDLDVEMTEEAWDQHWQELKERGSVVFERPHRAKDGRVFPTEVNANLFNYQGVSYNLALVRDITERKEKERLGTVLKDVNAIISSTLDFDKTMEHGVPLAIEVLGVESASVIIPEGGEWVVKYRFPKESIGRRFSNKDVPHLALAAKTKIPVAIGDTYNDPRVDPEVMRKYAGRAKLVIPLIASKEFVGLLVFSSREPMVFSSDRIDFATKVATSVSFALENVSLFETERNIADTLQEALLTIPEHIKGVEFGYLYRSATEASKVGGDFFDIFKLDADRVGVIVGDVSGKGLKAASLTSVVKSIVRAYAYEETSPAIVMKKTNETVKKAIPAPYFITIFLGIIDVKRRAITYCSAGHPPALIKRKGSVERLSVHSPIIGAFAGINYTQGDFVIDRGDILVLYTDGITEARSGREFFGEERLADMIENLPAITAKDMPHVIFKEVMDFAGGKLTDDVVLLSLALS